MRTTWVAADEMISPLGWTAAENYEAVRSGRTGISWHERSVYSKDPVYLGAINDINSKSADSPDRFTRFERFAVRSIEGALRRVHLDPASPRVIFILSTTKGNIELLEKDADNSHLHLPQTARFIAQHFGNSNTPLVVSSACVSGVTALLLGKRLVESGLYDHAVVTGVDILSRFIVSGFQCLSALSPEPCKPFDKNRKGTTLGEAAATLILTGDPGPIGAEPKISILGGGLTNDANHISGPSRTGEELATAIRLALKASRIDKNEVDIVSAHGTATLFNDEMEAKAFHLCGFDDVPLNSLKGNFGHTLGAAGIVETIMSMHGLLGNEILPTHGFEEMGVSIPVNVSGKLRSAKLVTCLKTASGFGGCNAAMVFRKAG